VSKPKLLDLFSGAGGAARGYQLAGFHVTGVDILPQPRYAGDHFCQADVMDVGLPALLRELGPFDAVHSSPPCHDHTRLSAAVGLDGTGWMLAAIRDALVAAGLPWVLENVPGAPLTNAVLLCGTMFGLRVRRHRLFETDAPIATLLPPCTCRGGVVRGELIGHRVAGRVGPGRRKPPRYTEAQRRDAIGVDWITARGARQAIPPAYTEWIGRQLLDHPATGPATGACVPSNQTTSGGVNVIATLPGLNEEMGAGTRGHMMSVKCHSDALPTAPRAHGLNSELSGADSTDSAGAEDGYPNGYRAGGRS
jgi:DNA (cytosine-5)-methyltransferase 1